MAQRLVRHHRPQVRAADPDVDHVADRPAGVAAPLPASDPLAEVAHPVEHPVDLLDHVDAVDDQRAIARHPQRNVKDRAVLGDVDPLAAEHRLAALGHAALLRQRDQQPQRLVRDAVLRVVEVEPGALGAHPLAAAGILGEQRAQVHPPDLLQVALQRDPGGALGERGGRGGHLRPSGLCRPGRLDGRARERRPGRGSAPAPRRRAGWRARPDRGRRGPPPRRAPCPRRPPGSASSGRPAARRASG